MDKDNLFRAIMAAMVALLVWSLISNALRPKPAPTKPQPTSIAAPEGEKPATPLPVPQGISVQGDEKDEEVFIDLGNVEDSPTSPYGGHVRLSPRGASLVSMRLTDHAKKVGEQERYELLKPVEPEGRPKIYSFTTDMINLGSPDALYLGQRFWNSDYRQSEEGQEAVFWLDFLKEGKAFARLTKTFFLAKSTSEVGHADLKISLMLENLSEEPLQLRVEQLGPVGVPQEDPRSDYRKVSAGVDDGIQVTVTSQMNSSLKPEPPFHLFSSENAVANLRWMALGNKFFAVIVAPEDDAQGQSWVIEAKAVRLAKLQDEKNDASFVMVFQPINIPAGESATISFDCYLGPKSKTLFTSDPTYAKRSYNQLVIDDYYWCAFTAIVNVMLGLLFFCHDHIPPYNYGMAIIFLVLIVRLILHPLTKKGQVNMTKMAQQMAVLQPKMEELRKKHANDKTRMNQETMKLYQQEGVNPAGQMLTCLPMMCQMPIWGGLWAALNFTVEMRHQPFFLWIHDLTAPDALFTFDPPITIPILGWPITSFNLLPPLLGLGMFLQQRLMPKPAAATRQATKSKDQMAQQRMMMNFMSIFMVVIFYNAPAGLTLYIMASNFFGLFEQYRIRKHIREEEELAKSRPEGLVQEKKKFKKPKFLEKLEKMADQAKKR